MRKRYYFILKKGSGKAGVELFMKLKDGKFGTTHQLHSNYLFNWWQANWYWLLFNLPDRIKKSSSMFKYAATNGTVHLRRLENEMLS